MSKKSFTRKRLALYAVPIVIGLGGVVISQQMPSLVTRAMVLVISVAVPVYAAGSLLARYRSSPLERVFLFVGVLMLIAGAAFSLSGLSAALYFEERIAVWAVDASRIIGITSLLLGLLVVLYAVGRTGEDIDEISERFQHLAEHISEGYILSTRDGIIIQVNDQFLEMTGLERREVIGQDSTELALRLNAGPAPEQVAMRKKGIASEYEVTWRVRGEERRFWFKGAPILDAHGRQTAILATVRDNTEHHRLSRRVERYAQGLQRLVEEQTQRLLQSEERFRQLLLTMNEGFLTIDAANRIRFANERICRLLHVGHNDLLNRDLFDFVDAAGRVRLLTLLAQGASRHRTESRRELNLVNAAGEQAPVVAAVAYIRDASAGEPVYSLVVTSVAEQKEMQHQLELRARELERVNEELRIYGRAKDGFLSNVSHELRTPLSTIQGYVEMLESGSLGQMAGPQLGALKVMSRNLQRLVGLISEMIEFSRMTIRGVQLNIDLFAVARLVREASASVHPQTLAKDISVNTFLPEGLACAWGDREKLGQVLGILLNNAIKFTQEGGLIQVQVSERPGQTLVIAVSDTGIGIEPAYQQQVFEKFFQVDSSKTRRYEGTGIGLSIAKSIVEAHAGTIELKSRSGEGSIFTVVLPGALFNEVYDQERAEEYKGLRVLIVAQDEVFRDSLEAVLGGAGCVVACAPNGHECVRKAEEMRPDVILLNDSQSDMAGSATLGLLRQRPVTETIPVVVFSAESPSRLKEAGGIWNDVLLATRPFDAKALMNHIRNACFRDAVASALPGASGGAGDEPSYVLIVDSDPGLLEWVEMALEHRQIPCCCTATPQDALKMAAHQAPVVLFVDMDVPGARVAEHAALFRGAAATAGVPIYAMTGLPAPQRVSDAVAGVLSKPFTIDEMIEIIESVERPAAEAGQPAAPQAGPGISN